MTEPELTPAQEDVVRRHLADARHTEPIPDDVADRLDAVLAGLRADTSEKTSPAVAAGRDEDELHAPVIDLAARRRRRFTQGLVAAAFVVVAGVGATQLGLPSGGDGSADMGAEPASVPSYSAQEGERDPLGAPSASPGTGNTLTSGVDVPTVRPEHFAFDAEQLSSKADLAPTSGEEDSNAATTPCVRPARGESALAVYYRNLLSTLLFHRPVNHTQEVELYVCGERTAARRATVPAP